MPWGWRADCVTSGARAGLAIKPGTDVAPYLDIVSEFDQILVMTVEPGFGGQKFMEATDAQAGRAAQVVARTGADIWLQVDGGVTELDHRDRRRGGRRHLRRGLKRLRRREPALAIRPSAPRPSPIPTPIDYPSLQLRADPE